MASKSSTSAALRMSWSQSLFCAVCVKVINPLLDQRQRGSVVSECVHRETRLPGLLPVLAILIVAPPNHHRLLYSFLSTAFLYHQQGQIIGAA